MKTKKVTLVVLLHLVAVFNAWSQTARDASYDLFYDFGSKQWAGKTFAGKYFIVPYKTQQRIFVCNLPKDYAATVDGQSIEVTPEAAQPEALPERDSLRADSLQPCRVFYISKTIEFDEMEYTLQIKDDADVVIEESFVFAKVFGGLKIDISTGVVFHSLANESYHFSDGGNDQFTLVKDKKKGDVFPISPVILTHFHTRAKGFASLGTTLGLGINDDGKVGYYLGAALLVGDRQRGVISAGVAFRPVDVLKGKYQKGQVFDGANVPEEEDLIESNFKTGFFFSFSYNLSSKVDRKK